MYFEKGAKKNLWTADSEWKKQLVEVKRVDEGGEKNEEGKRSHREKQDVRNY